MKKFFYFFLLSKFVEKIIQDSKNEIIKNWEFDEIYKINSRIQSLWSFLLPWILKNLPLIWKIYE